MKKEPAPDGSFGIDFDAFVCEAIRLSGHETVEWAIEEQTATPHPTQQPVPAGRHVYDIHHE